MKIKKLHSENLYSFETLDIELDQYPGGTTLLLGRNLDQKTSNGSGKSTIMKSLYFALYGEDVAGANKAAVLRRGAPKGWYVTIEFEDRGHKFKIERFEGRKDKHSTGKGLNFFIDGGLFNGEGVEETQKIINQKIRITPRLFLSSIYSAQNSKSNFLVESDTNKKEMLSELLDLQIYAKAFDYIKDEISSIEEKIKDREGKIEAANEQLKAYDDQVKQLIGQRDHFSTDLKEQISKENEELNVLIAKIEEVKKATELKYDLKKIKAEIESLRKERTKLETELSNESKIKITLEKIGVNITQLNSDKESIRRDISALNKEIIELDGITFNEAQLDSILAEKVALEESLKEIDLNKEKINALNLKFQSEKSEHAQLIKDLALIEAAIKKLVESKDCPTCHRPYEAEHLTHVQNEVFQLEENKAKIEASIKQSQEKILKTQSEGLALKEKIKEESILKDKVKGNQNKILEFNLASEKFKLKEKEREKKFLKIEELNKNIAEKNEKISKFEFNRTEVEKLDLELIPLRERLTQVDSTLTDINHDLIHAEVEFKQSQQVERTLQGLNDQKDKIVLNITNLKGKKNPYGEMIEVIEKRSTTTLDRIKQLQDQIEKEKESMKYLNFWKVGFAPTGIRSFITDDVIDLLNRKVQENLNDLFDGAISVFFDPESKNKKGVVSNKISTNFFLNGKETPKESLSGGELRRAILATELALTEIAESRSGNKLNVRFLDEPFDGMDSNGQLQAFKLFARLSKDKDGFFVISHDENFQNMCPNVIYVIKKNEVSRIVDKNQFLKSNIETDEDSGDDMSSAAAAAPTGTDKKSILAERLKELAKNKN